MIIEVGTRLGPYTILAPIGAGGMGEVYRARDTRLERDVALKILPELFAADPGRLARFEREAKTLASLNHPHIASIYGIESVPPTRAGDSDGVLPGLALVMELVDGHTLEAVIARSSPGEHGASVREGRAWKVGRGSGPSVREGWQAAGVGPRGISIDDALPIARQIAEALEAAHERGIIHRDLKPANIMLTAGADVKVLDFGLAKAVEPAAVGLHLEQSPTFTSPIHTSAGMILGTAAYMSPEQARGRPVDRRADLWAFGCVLFEMLSGRPAFAGDTVTDILAAIVSRDPDWSALPSETTPEMRRLLQRCLERDPRRRLGDAGEARYQLEEMLAAPGRAASRVEPDGRGRDRLRRAVPWVVAAAMTLSAAWLWARPGPDAPPTGLAAGVVRATLSVAAVPPHGANNSYLSLAVSPDGRFLAYVTADDPARLMLHDLSGAESRVLAEGQDLGEPFFSPDGQSVAFAYGFGGASRPDSPGLGGVIRRVGISGGAPTTVVQDTGSFKGGSWGDDGWIYYSPAPGLGLWRVPAAGGTPEVLTTPDHAKGEKSHGGRQPCRAALRAV